ncbi:hypothetical protein D3C87_1975920 [compost metagenome]
MGAALSAASSRASESVDSDKADGSVFGELVVDLSIPGYQSQGDHHQATNQEVVAVRRLVDRESRKPARPRAPYAQPP